MCEAFDHVWILCIIFTHGITWSWPKSTLFRQRRSWPNITCQTEVESLLILFVEWWVTEWWDAVCLGNESELHFPLWVMCLSQRNPIVGSFLELRLSTNTQLLVLWIPTYNMKWLGHQMQCMGARRLLLCCYWTVFSVSSPLSSLKLSACGIRWSHCFH